MSNGIHGGSRTQPTPRQWIGVECALPCFIKYGFHTGQKIRVVLDTLNEVDVLYEGYGIFSKNGKILDNVTHWTPP